jgi:hypothetical protein
LLCFALPFSARSSSCLSTMTVCLSYGQGTAAASEEEGHALAQGARLNFHGALRALECEPAASAVVGLRRRYPFCTSSHGAGGRRSKNVRGEGERGNLDPVGDEGIRKALGSCTARETLALPRFPLFHARRRKKDPGKIWVQGSRDGDAWGVGAGGKNTALVGGRAAPPFGKDHRGQSLIFFPSKLSRNRHSFHRHVHRQTTRDSSVSLCWTLHCPCLA